MDFLQASRQHQVMRTTVNIEGPVLEELRRLQRREGTTLGGLVSRLLKQAMAEQRGSTARGSLGWNAQPMGALVDLEEKAAVQSALDRPHA